MESEFSPVENFFLRSGLRPASLFPKFFKIVFDNSYLFDPNSIRGGREKKILLGYLDLVESGPERGTRPPRLRRA